MTCFMQLQNLVVQCLITALWHPNHPFGDAMLAAAAECMQNAAQQARFPMHAACMAFALETDTAGLWFVFGHCVRVSRTRGSQAGTA